MKKIGNKDSSKEDFTTTLLLKQAPEAIFDAINNVRGWWSEAIEGITDRLNAEFIQYYQDIHIAKMRIIEFVPGKKVTWLVEDSHFNFTSDEREWKDTEICFELSLKGDQTQVLFTHRGLVPAQECYQICHDAWSQLIHHSLRNLIISGKGEPNPKESGGFSAKQDKRWTLANT